ncbi:hypothetical protein LTR09_003502 [Extremus antarcticus]|uniref:Thioesterase domain-containing protein n=1 Tax=Extremus antarcticus TaxID=702011 RepID=A0AAJ0GDA1_9PEZI|nr:hypothetical protein LTR09_003502 [Extremus antarcticus]
MSIVSKQQKTAGPDEVAKHPDFQLPWIERLLANPQKEWTVQVPRPYLGGTVTNAMFERTLGTPDGIRAHLSFNRPSQEPDAINHLEECWLLSCGSDVDGRAGRAHGGFNTLVLDQISGSISHHSHPQPEPPATATLTVDFKAPVSTPCVVLLRAWITELSGRKVWVKAVMENGDGKVVCASNGLFVFPRQEKI